MCGIVGYIGSTDVTPLLIEGLKRLEYRGYDSAGIAVLADEAIHVRKCKGKVSDLERQVRQQPLPTSTLGIAHTRWATHGEPNHINAHPHLSGNQRLAIVHNGIIENYHELRQALAELGHHFISETDTEVLVHLIEEYQEREQCTLVEAVRSALKRVVGAYAIVVMDRTQPDQLVAARLSSPLVIGLADEGYFVASDATPIVPHTNKVIYLNDGEIALIRRTSKVQITNIDNQICTPQVQELDMKLEEIEKGGYPHFMLKEIHQQPLTVADAMRGRIDSKVGWIRLGGMTEHLNRILRAPKFTLLGCGTSWHAALIGEYLLEDIARIPVEVEYASEFRYRNPVIRNDEVVIAISQSGETLDTMAALELAKREGAFTYGIVNVVGSSIARMTQAGSYIHCGPEIGVASTKAFTGQVTVLTLMALYLAHLKGVISRSYFHQLLTELETIPEKIQTILRDTSHIEYIASEIKDNNNALYLGRGYNFPVALEGALKLKEISYIHAEGYPAAEMKHGPIALIDENMPVIVITTNTSAHDKIKSNIEEIKARKGKVIAITTEEQTDIQALVDYSVTIPKTIEPLSPLLSVIPLQLLAYYIAVMRGCNVDQPRNLAKSVTVE